MNGWLLPMFAAGTCSAGAIVKAGAFRHISTCFRNSLAKRGLQLGKWDDEKQAHLLVPL